MCRLGLILFLSACDAIFAFRPTSGSPADQRIDSAQQDAVADLPSDDAKSDVAVDVSESDAGKPDADAWQPMDLVSNDGAADADAGNCTSPLSVHQTFTYWNPDGPDPPSIGTLAVEWEPGSRGSALLSSLLHINDSCGLRVSVKTELSGQDAEALTVGLYNKSCGWATCTSAALLFECTIDVPPGMALPNCETSPIRSGTARTVRLTAATQNTLRVNYFTIVEIPP